MTHDQIEDTNIDTAAPEPTVPPAELAVLGAILLEPRLAERLSPVLDGTDFLEPRHEAIWATIQTLAAGGVLPDAITVGDRLNKQGQFIRLGGAPYLHSLMEACNNPTNATEYASQVRDARRLRQVDSTAIKLRQLAWAGNADGIDAALADAQAAITEAVNSLRSPSTSKYDGQFLDRTQLDQLITPAWIIDGVIPGAAYGSEIGRDGTLKSFVAQDWAACIATGRPWQGRPVTQARVLYIAAEGAFGLRARFDAWEQAWRTTIPEGALTIRTSALSLYKTSDEFTHLLEHVTAGAYRFVVIDTLRRVSGSADGNTSDMGTIVDNIDRIKKATGDGTVLVIAHTDKGDKDTRGFSGIEDDADFVWHAKRDEDHLELTNTKMKDAPDGHVFHLHARSVANSLVLEEAGATIPAATESQIKILDTLRNLFPDGATTKQLITGSGIAESTYYRVIAGLKKDGHVLNIGTARVPFLKFATLADSLPLSPEKPSDQGNSHGLSPTPTNTPATPLTPAALMSGSESEDNVKTQENTA
jgi:hypothetical protein